MKTTILGTILIFCFSIFAAAQDSSAYLKKAGDALNKGDIRGAISVLDDAVKQKRTSFDIYRMRSSLNEMLGNLQPAFDDLSKAIEIKPMMGELYENRSSMRMFLGHDQSLILSDLDFAIANGRKIEKVYRMRASLGTLAAILTARL